MILEVCLSTRADRNESFDNFYLSPEAVKNGVRVDYILPSQYREYVGCIHVKTSADGQQVEVSSKYGSRKYPINQKDTWKSGPIGLSYASCEISITMLPYIQEYWDVLLTTHDATLTIRGNPPRQLA